MNTQPEALRLAEISPYLENSERSSWNMAVCAELRRLHEVNAELVKALQGVLEYDRCEIPIREYEAAIAAIAKATGEKP